MTPGRPLRGAQFTGVFEAIDLQYVELAVCPLRQDEQVQVQVQDQDPDPDDPRADQLVDQVIDGTQFVGVR